MPKEFFDALTQLELYLRRQELTFPIDWQIWDRKRRTERQNWPEAEERERERERIATILRDSREDLRISKLLITQAKHMPNS